MNEETRRRIDEVMGSFECPKGFTCAANGFEHLCAAEDIQLEGHLVCREPSTTACAFAVPFGSEYFCRCQLRVFLARNLEM